MAKFLDYTGLQILVEKIKEHVSNSVSAAKSTLQANIDKKVDKTITVNGHALSSNVTVSKSDVGLGSVDNVQQIPMSQKGAASGVATLGSDGKLTSSQLPALKTINGSSIVGSGNITIDLSLYKLVDELPSTGIDNNKIYLVKSSGSGAENVYTEYIHVTPSSSDGEAAWEKLGEYKSDVDLTPYVKFTDIATTSKAGAMSTAMVTKLNGIADGATKVLVDDSLSTTSTNPVQNKVIKAALDGKASSSHTHQNLKIQLNSGTTEGTNQFTYNGSTAKSLNITPSSIGAATSGHNHDSSYVTSLGTSGNSLTWTKGGTANNITVPYATNSGHATSADSATSATSATTATTATTANKVSNSFVIKVNTPTTATEGTNTYTFNGSAAKTLDIKAGSNVTLTPAAGTLTISSKDTTYSAGTGIKISSGTISVNTNGNPGQFLNGNGSWSTPANTTYSAGTGLGLSGTTFNLDVAGDGTLGGLAVGYEENGKNYPVELDEDNKAFVNVPWTDTTYGVATTVANGLMSSADKTKLNGIADGANKYVHPTQTAHSSGLYKVTINETGHVSAATSVSKSDITALGIPAQDTKYSAGDGLTLSGTTFSVNAEGTTSGKKYAVTIDDTDGNLYVNVPWTDNNTTYTAGTGLTLSSNKFSLNKATTSALGGVKLYSATAITSGTPVAAVSAGTSNRLYPVQLNGSDQMVVNVPWTDTVDTAIPTSEIEALFN